MIAQHPEPINIPSDRDAYRAWLRDLDVTTRRLLFGAERGDTEFRCPTNGRRYADEAAVLREEGGVAYIESSCFWCDVHGRVRGEAGFDRSRPQPHVFVIVEHDDAPPKARAR